MRIRGGLVAIGLVAIGLAGCGGGGSNGPTLATQTRALQVGDQWVYAITGSGTNGAGQAVTLTGSMTVTISNMPFNNGASLAQETVTHLSSSDGQSSNTDTILYISQDASTRNILEVGDNGGSNGSVRIAFTPKQIAFGSWSNGETFDLALHFTNGDAVTGATYTVAGSETAATPLGSFSAWKVTAAGFSTTALQDWAPQLGAPVKISNMAFSFGSPTVTATGTVVLQSTTVPH